MTASKHTVADIRYPRDARLPATLECTCGHSETILADRSEPDVWCTVPKAWQAHRRKVGAAILSVGGVGDGWDGTWKHATGEAERKWKRGAA